MYNWSICACLLEMSVVALMGIHESIQHDEPFGVLVEYGALVAARRPSGRIDECHVEQMERPGNGDKVETIPKACFPIGSPAIILFLFCEDVLVEFMYKLHYPRHTCPRREETCQGKT